MNATAPVLNGWSVRGEVVLRSIEPATKPDFFSVGGFCTEQDGEITIFDWTGHYGNTTQLEDGRCEAEFVLNGFDVEFFQHSNEHLTGAPDWEKITSSVLDEVHYEAGHHNQETGKETHIPFEVVSLKVEVTAQDSLDVATFAFTPEQINAYNEAQTKEQA